MNESACTPETLEVMAAVRRNENGYLSEVKYYVSSTGRWSLDDHLGSREGEKPFFDVAIERQSAECNGRRLVDGDVRVRQHDH